MKSYHYYEIKQVHKDKLALDKKNPSDIKIVRIGLVDYVHDNDKLIPVTEYFELKREQKI